MTPTEHEKNEWLRFAEWAYYNNHTVVGDRYLKASWLPEGVVVTTQWFDRIQQDYWKWLLFDKLPSED